MKKKPCLISYFLAFSLFSTPLFANEAPETPGPILGEKLTFRLRWGLVPVGWCTMHVRSVEEYKGRKVYRIIVKGWSNSFLSTFYKVRDHVETYMDVDGLFTWRFYKKQREGRYRSDEEMVYDQELNHAYYHSFRNGSRKDMKIPPKVQDALSAIYFFRTMPLKVGESVFIDVNADEKNYRLEIQVEKFRKKWKVHRFGVFDAFYVEPIAEFNGLVQRKGKVWVWISADRRRLPLFVKSKLPFGSVTATLVKAEIVKERRSSLAQRKKKKTVKREA